MVASMLCQHLFFFNDTATTEIYTLSLHDALPICRKRARHGAWRDAAAGTPALPERRRQPARRYRRGARDARRQRRAHRGAARAPRGGGGLVPGPWRLVEDVGIHRQHAALHAVVDPLGISLVAARAQREK